MNRLLGHRVYLAGPIDRCPEGGAKWRDQITPLLWDRGLAVIDPLKKPVDAGLEDDDSRRERSIWKKIGDFVRFALFMRRVRVVDLRLVDVSDFLIVRLDLDIPMCGTWEELFWANRGKKPVLVWCPQGVAAVPDWLFGTLPHQMFFPTLEATLAYVDHVATAPKVDTLDRWLFLRVDRMTGPPRAAPA